MKPYKYIISGGGTGGHIYPAIAIANKIKAHDPAATIVFVGGIGKMEMKKVPQAGYPIHGLWIAGIQRKNNGKYFIPLSTFCEFFSSLFFLWVRYRPDLLIGTGGFASGPMLFVGSLLGVKPFYKNKKFIPRNYQQIAF